MAPSFDTLTEQDLHEEEEEEVDFSGACRNFSWLVPLSNKDHQILKSNMKSNLRRGWTHSLSSTAFQWSPKTADKSSLSSC